MHRRDFLLVVAALGAIGGAAPADPLEELPRALRKRLAAFAKAVERHAWPEVVGYFDREHHAAQHKLYFSPELNEDPPDPNDPSAQDAFVEWYVLETLGLRMVDNSVDAVDDVVAIRFHGWEEPFGVEGPLKILLEVDTKVGARTGWLYVDRVSHAFSGSVG